MTLTELAARNISAGFREVLNGMMAMDAREILMKPFCEKPWYDEEDRQHRLLRSKLAEIVGELDTIQRRMKKLMDFESQKS